MLADRKRIMVVGSGGAGKSTFARELERVTGLPLFHLDRLHWNPGWTPTPRDEWRGTVENLAANDEWIIDGNYGGTLKERVLRCDAIVFFDFNRLTCLFGVVRRTLTSWGESRPDMAEGCPERLDWNFVRWVWSYPETSRPKVARAIEQAGPDVVVLIVKTRRDVRNVLKAMASGSGPRGGVGVSGREQRGGEPDAPPA
jgi:adenylate kinase family enzyme